jgi:hypothetical protein
MVEWLPKRVRPYVQTPLPQKKKKKKFESTLVGEIPKDSKLEKVS